MQDDKNWVCYDCGREYSEERFICEECEGEDIARESKQC